MAYTKKDAVLLYEASFTGEKAVRIASVWAQNEFLQKMKRELEVIPIIKDSTSLGLSTEVGPGTQSITFYLNDKNLPSQLNYFNIRFSKENELIVHNYRVGDYKIDGIEEILRHFELLKKASEVFKHEKTKKLKIRSLKISAILSSFEEIAAEENFEYAYDYDTVKIVIKLRLEKNRVLNINIPFSKFQEVLPKVRPLIRNVIDLGEHGIVFTVKNETNVSWKKPKKI
jgi:hypothetical protein